MRVSVEIKFIQIKYVIYLICFLSVPLTSYSQETFETTLEADGPGDTYQLLSSVLGGTPYEVPDCDHSESFQHIDEVFDNELQNHVFRFYIHTDVDTDRCRTNVDRQRNEIKTYGPSPEYLLGNYGETFTYEWYFKIDEGFQPSSRFTHLFQLKASGGSDDENPIFTLTPRSGNPNQLELIHGKGNGIYTNVKTVDLNQIAGKWVKVYCEATFLDDNGDLTINIQLLDGTEVISYTDQVDLWREGADFVRPKWGIYRSLGASSSLRDETVLFADFKITEIKNECPTWYEDADKDGLGDPNNPIVSCTQPNGYVSNDDDLSCRYYYEDADEDNLGDPSVSVYSCDQPEGYVKNDADEDCGMWYEDKDGDGLGNAEVSHYSCEPKDGYVRNGADDDDEPITSILKHEETPVFLFPTNAKDYVNIFGIDEPKYHIFNLNGVLLQQGKGNTIDISNLNDGLYIMRVNNLTLKFFKL